jgi:uncharacterized phage protein (TIGR01671 family)
MRQIKFRYYSKYSSGEWAKDEVTLLEIEDGYFKKPFLDGIVHRVQFTGLLDKNGKEIYEGDIIKNNRYPSLSKVVWKQGEGAPHKMLKGLFGEEEDIGGFISNIGGFYFESVGSNTLKAHYVGEFEVIGNIYENENLLK